MTLLTCCQHTFQNFTGYEESIDELKNAADVLTKEVSQTSAEIMKTSDRINSTVEMVKTKVDGSAVEELERRVTDVEQNSTSILAEPPRSWTILRTIFRPGFRRCC